VGPYSQIEYGKKGDQVEVVEVRCEMILVDNNGLRFHVKMENLTDTVPCETVQDPVEETKPVTVKTYSKPVLKTTKKGNQSNNQSQLF
jgi:hypothetical protein